MTAGETSHGAGKAGLGQRRAQSAMCLERNAARAAHPPPCSGSWCPSCCSNPCLVLLPLVTAHRQSGAAQKVHVCACGPMQTRVNRWGVTGPGQQRNSWAKLGGHCCPRNPTGILERTVPVPGLRKHTGLLRRSGPGTGYFLAWEAAGMSPPTPQAA